jgi:hypothetical protein
VKFSIIFFFILSLPIEVKAEPCDATNSDVYLNFIFDLKKPMNPIARFNIKYLVNNLRSHGIKEDEIAERISGYTATLSQLHENIIVNSFYASNDSGCNNYIYKVTGAPIGYESYKYVAVSLVESKIINISFEANDTILDGKSFSQLPFVSIK